jgi:hypothetical protein
MFNLGRPLARHLESPAIRRAPWVLLLRAGDPREQLVAFLPECLSEKMTARMTSRFPQNHEPHGNDSLVRCENLDMWAINRSGPRRHLREENSSGSTSVQIKLSRELVGLLARSSEPRRRQNTARLARTRCYDE